ncbi:TPA: hypothetical protein N0X47_002730 [Pseudomonas aeruginosa]|nr:hypothetical protein [Pseudomonas aeruginosa]
MSRSDLFSKQKKLRDKISGRPLMHPAADAADVEALLNSPLDTSRIATLDYFSMISINSVALPGEDLALIKRLEKAFERNRLDQALEKAQRDVIGAIAGPLGLGKVLSVHEKIGDKNGGNVTTIHNAKQKIYARKEDEYRRDDYTKSLNRQGKKFQGKGKKSVGSQFVISQMDADRNVTDGYTGKKLKAEETSPDHIISTSSFHKNGGFMLSAAEKADFGTDTRNLVITKRSINQSMSDHEKQEWIARRSGKREVENGEHYEVDPELVRQVVKRGEEAAAEHAPTIAQKGKFYGVNSAKTGISEGLKMGAQQVFGLIMVEFFSAATLEIKDMYQRYADKSPVLDEVNVRLIRVGKTVASKWDGVIKGFGQGFISGFISNIVTVLINMVCTTGKRLVRMIREGVFSLMRALGMFIFKPEDMTWEQASHEGLKLLGAAGILIGGIALEEVLEKMLMTFPPLIPFAGQLTAIIIGASTSFCMIFACYLLDKLDLFGAIKLERDKHVIHKLDESIEQRITSSNTIIAEIERYLPSSG